MAFGLYPPIDFIQDHGGGSARIKSCQWPTASGIHTGTVPQVSGYRIVYR